MFLQLCRSRYNYRLDGPGLIPGTARFFFSQQRPDRFWGPLSLLANGFRELFPWRYRCRSVKLTTHLHLVPTSRMVELYLHSPIRLHDIVFN
jgi:hypothetical protein